MRDSADGPTSSSDDPPALSVLIVNYGPPGALIRCVESVRDEPQSADWELLVVDNASTPDTRAQIRESDPTIRLLAEEKNLGFARAVNLGAREASGELLLLLNPDCVALPGSLSELVSFHRLAGDDAIVGPRTIYPDGSLNPYSCFRAPSLWSQFCVTTGLTALARGHRWFDPGSCGYRVGSDPETVDIVSGCCLLLSRSLWLRLDGFDPVFFLYGEEFDLCLRAAQVGAHVHTVPRAVVMHEGGRPDPESPTKFLHFMRSKHLLVDRHLGRLQRRFAHWLVDLWVVRRWATWTVLGALHPHARARRAALGRAWKRRSEWRRAAYRTRPNSSG